MRSFHYLLSLVLLPVVTVSARRLAICDVGSNGIRFGVLDSLERDLPNIFKERAPISLFEAQHMPEQGEDVEENVLKDVEDSMRRFADIAHDAEFRIVATEASRTAHNSEELRKRIKKATEVEVELLTKEEESRLSALGISATLYNPTGPSMDLGGGSLEINYLTNGQDASVSGSGFLPQSIKCGSRVVGRRLQKEDKTTVRDHVLNEIKVAKTAMLGNEKNCDDQTLYLTGGGFRAIGYIAMSYDPKYPFSTINGFTIGAAELRTICTNFAEMDPHELEAELEKVPNIRKERYAQMHANFLIMLAAIEAINPVDITFAEGGVRHGLAFTLMSEEEKQRDPLAASTDRFTTKMGCAVSAEEQKQLAEYPSENDDVKEGSPAIISPRLVDAAIRLVHLADDQTDNLFQLIKHAPLVGLTHQERAVLLLILIHRYGEDSRISSDGKGESLPLTAIENLAGGGNIVEECKRIGGRMKEMIPQPVNVLGSVDRLGVNARPAIEVKTYATKLGSLVQDKEMKALGEWCSTYFLSVDKDKALIPPRVVLAAIQLVHVAHAFGSESQAAVAFEFIMRAQFVGLTKEDHAKLALILLYRYKGDRHSDAKGWDMKALFKKKPTKIRKACQAFGKMLRLAMEVNPTGDLEAKRIELLAEEETNHMKVVVNDRTACGVDVPRIRKMLKKMKKKHDLYIKLDVSKVENDPISSSTSEAISSDAQSAKDPISSSTDAIAPSPKDPSSSSTDEAIAQSLKYLRSSSTDEEMLAASQSLENPSSDAPSAGDREKPCESWPAGFHGFGCDF